MAQRRMFSKRITNTDLFLEMPLSAQALYFHLNMEADDDGFIDKAKTIRRTIGASEDDLKILKAKQFIVEFESGVVVVKHWRIHNLIRKDTYQPTFYQAEKALIELEMPSYKKKKPKNVDNTLTNRQQDVVIPLTQDRIGKDRLEEDSIGEDIVFPSWLTPESIKSVKKGNPKNYKLRIPIAYLNQVLQKRKPFLFVENNIKHIKARFNEGHTLEDFKYVVDVKFAEWSKDEKMSKYLQPDTLFGTKFNKYISQEMPKGHQEPTVSDIEERLGF